MKALHDLDGRQVAELVKQHNPTPDDSEDIFLQTLIQCSNPAPFSFLSLVSGRK